MLLERKMIILLSFVAVLVIGAVVVPYHAQIASLTSKNSHPSVVEMETLNESIPMSFSSSKSFSSSIVKNVTNIPEFNSSLLVENLPSFNDANTTAYVGDDVIPLSMPSLYWYNVTFLNVTIFNDHDSIGAGDIYFKIWINGNLTREPLAGDYPLNDGESKIFNLPVFNGWAWNISIRIEIWDADTGYDDYVGSIVYAHPTTTNQTITMLTDTGDASLSVSITTYLGLQKSSMTASELLDGYKPYIYIEDGTSGTEEPNAVHGRVVKGNDSIFQKELLALQYFFYWDKETFGTPTSVDVHVNDFEEVLLFVDPTSLGRPVRVVLDVANTTRPSHDIQVYELNHGNVGTSMNASIGIQEEFQPFLGSLVNATYTKNDLNIVLGQYLTTSLFGSSTINITVATFYHTFQLGGPTSSIKGDTELSYHYEINELNDTILENWYSILNDTLHGTIITVNLGVIDYTTPRISPFTYDVVNPFQEPYIVNAWDNVMENLEYFSKAKAFNLTLASSLRVTATIKQEARLEFQVPSQVTPGTAYQIDYGIQVFDDTVYLILDYALTNEIYIKYWYLEKNFTMSHSGSLTVNISKASIESILSEIGIDSQDIENKLIGKINEKIGQAYLEVTDLSVSTTILGHVLGASVKLHAWQLIRDRLPPLVFNINPTAYFFIKNLFKVIDKLVLNHLDLVADINLDSIIFVSLDLPNSGAARLDRTLIEFNETHRSGHLILTIDANYQGSQALELVITTVSNGVDFYVDWSGYMEFKLPVSLILNSVGFSSSSAVYLGRYPSYQKVVSGDHIQANVTNQVVADIAISSENTSTSLIPSKTTTATSSSDNASETSTSTSAGTPEIPATTSSPGFDLLLVIFVIVTGLISRRVKINPKKREI